MLTRLVQPNGNSALETTKQTLAINFEIDKENVVLIESGSSITSSSLLYHQETQSTWDPMDATGSIVSISFNIDGSANLVTSTGSFNVVPYTILKNKVPVAGTLGDLYKDYTFESFGAKGDGVTDDTAAIQRAISHSQLSKQIVRASPGATYLVTDTLDLVALPTENTYLSAKIYGNSETLCKLKFVGSDSTKPAVRAKGNSGVSGSNSAYGVNFCGFYLDCTNWAGNGIHWENIALWSLLQDIQVWLPGGHGIYAVGYTDHIWRNIEVRGAGGYGIYSYEPTIAADGYFHEVSFMRFESVRAFASNNYGVQWRFEGGNGCIFDNCKPSEGQVGLDFYRSVGHTLLGTYVDGTGKVSGSINIAIRINDSSCINYNIIGGRFWNVKYVVYIDKGGYVNCGPWSLAFDTSTYGSSVFDVYIGDGVTLPVNVPIAAAVSDNSSGMWLYSSYNARRINYTPSFVITGGSVTNGSATRTGYFTKNSSAISINARFTVAADTVIEGSNLTFVLPATTTVNGQMIQCVAYDVSEKKMYHGAAMITGQGATMYFDKTVTVQAADIANAYPFVPAAGDFFQISGQYVLK